MDTTFPEPVRTFSDIDKTTWPDGPWKDEPDKVQWVDPATSLDCLIVRQDRLGHLCGYVGVPEGHPLFGKDYHSTDALEVHGGITFADKCHENGRICHLPFPGRPDHIWWLGFDCAHAFDLSPLLNVGLLAFGIAPWRDDTDVYRTIAYVKAECERLAQQLFVTVPPAAL